MMNTIDKLTDFLLVLGINNMAFVMLLAGVLYFLPEPIDALAAPLCPSVITDADKSAVADADRFPVCPVILIPDAN